MNEKEFIERIDCQFPYSDKQQASELIKEAARISTNALFKVVEEIACVPAKEVELVSQQRLLELLLEVKDNLKHPLKEDILSIAEKMIKGEYILIANALTVMDELVKFKGEWSVLNIVYLSTIDTNEELECKYNVILNNWLK